MFIKLSVTHSHHPTFGFRLNQSVTEEYVNFGSVIRFYRRETSEFTAIRFQEGTLIGVSETPEDIFEKLK